MIKGWPVDHVHLVVQDLRESLSFYRDLLGFEARGLGSSSACLSPPSANRCVIYLEQGAMEVDRENYVYHIAILVPSRGVLGAILENILKSWDRVEGYADHLVSEAIYLRDPDNIGVEIYSDRDRSTWAWDERGFVAMDTQPLDIDGLILYARRLGARPRVTSDTIVGHVHLRGSDPEAGARFYREVLGMRITGVWFGARFLAYGDYHHHLAINSWPIPRPAEGSGLRSFAIKWERIPTPMPLERAGVGELELGCGASKVIRDPNGFTVEIMD